MSLLLRLSRALPRPVLERLDRVRRSSRTVNRVYKLVRGQRNDVMTIEQGIGAGLKIDMTGAVLRYGLGLAEETVQKALSAHIRPGSVFYDVGANVGFLALIGGRLVGPQGRVVAFEPVPETAQQLRRNLDVNGFSHVEVVEAAVGAEAGHARMTLEPQSQTSHLSSLAGMGSGEVAGEIDVPVVTIDGLVAQGKPVPDVVKIDIEGAEVLALEGMQHTLQTARPTVICELHGTLDAVRSELQRYGYHTEQLRDPHGVSLDHLVATHPSRS